MDSSTVLDQNLLKDILHYDPESGLFRWTYSRGRAAKGKLAGTMDKKGYVRIEIYNKGYMAHVLSFLYMTGAFPEEQVDHINNIKHDNRWDNLRLCNNSQNKQNTPMYKNNTTGVKGVSKLGTRYIACVKLNNNSYTKSFNITELGNTVALESAKTWVESKRKELHVDFARHI